MGRGKTSCDLVTAHPEVVLLLELCSLKCQRCWCCGVLRELLIDLVEPPDAPERSEMLS